jgi:Tat protein secretion system quality control protein TatD with DNase activity
VLNPHARRLHEALPFVAAEMLVVETDMPHEPPVRLRDVISQVAAILGVPAADVARRTSENARRVFRV